ncbi:hypothetical protein [Vibrio mimicus]|uniref:hypothetical protein n=1 Tax=Vibrio mimicus TaxID=674 RepID=UPI002FF11353
MWVTANRASRVLYNFLISLEKPICFLIPANVCPIVLATFIKAKVPYRLLDIDRKTLCIDLKILEQYLRQSEDDFGLLFVRTFGYTQHQESDLDTLKTIHENLAVIIDDRCLDIPQVDATAFSESIDMTLFSTGYSKYVELGYGGYGWLSKTQAARYSSPDITYDEVEHEKLVSDFNHAILSKVKFIYRYDNWLDNRILPHSLEEYFQLIRKKSAETKDRKAQNNAIYRHKIKPELWLGEEFDNWRFSILVSNKTQLLDSIFANGDFASSHYASLAGIFDTTQAPVAEMIHSQIVNLFNDYRCDEAMAKRVAKIVKSEAIA